MHIKNYFHYMFWNNFLYIFEEYNCILKPFSQSFTDKQETNVHCTNIYDQF